MIRQQTGHSGGPGHAWEQEPPKSTKGSGFHYLLFEKDTEGFLEEGGLAVRTGLGSLHLGRKE